MSRTTTRPSPARRLLPLALATFAIIVCGSEALRAQSDTGAAPPKQDLANWWMRNAASFHPIPERWLFHAEANYSFSLSTGNTEGEMHNGSGRIYLRKNRSTLSVRGGIMKQRLSFARDVVEVSQERYRVAPTLDYDLTPALGLQAGFLWEHDDAAFIESRSISYLGLKTVPYSSRNLMITAMPAFGYQYEQAILTEEERSMWVPYFEETIMWQPVKEFRIHHEANLLFSLEESETYRVRLAHSLEFPITSFFSLMFNHELRYNNNPIPSTEAVRQITGGKGTISLADNELTAGFRLQY